METSDEDSDLENFKLAKRASSSKLRNVIRHDSSKQKYTKSRPLQRSDSSNKLEELSSDAEASDSDDYGPGGKYSEEVGVRNNDHQKSRQVQKRTTEYSFSSGVSSRSVTQAGSESRTSRTVNQSKTRPLYYTNSSSDEEGKTKREIVEMKRKKKRKQESSDEEFLQSSESDEEESEDDDDDWERKFKNAKKQRRKTTGMGKSSRLSKFTRYSNDLHANWCKVCRKVGDLICCDSCPEVYHLECLDPPLTKVPSGNWECPMCDDPLPLVKEILTWRQVDGSRPPRREFFVRFDQRSYWECRWVTEYHMNLFQKSKISCYYKKFGSLQPPTLNDHDARMLRKNKNDPMVKRFYQHGVRPEWLRIHRVVDHYLEEDESVSYLVKWRGFGYDFLTWENDQDEPLGDIMDEFLAAQQLYQEWRQHFWGKTGLPPGNQSKFSNVKMLRFPPRQPTTDMTVKLKEQPSYLPPSLVLHDYQMDGLNWMRYSWANGINTILADEMGLGKTIQTIVFLYSLYKEGHRQGPFLISVPLSTITNWEREFELWAPDMYVVTYVGEKNTRQAIRNTEFTENSRSSILPGKVKKGQVKFHVLLTSYQFPSMDITCLSSISWEVIVVDEGHRLKTETSMFLQDLNTYRTKYKLLLTGTPLQNNLQELFCLLNFLCPEKFPNVSNFLLEFEDITKEEQIQKLQDLLGPHLLRRVKADVFKNIPPKAELIVPVELCPMQKTYMRHILERDVAKVNVTGFRHTSLLNILMDLRKICDHPYLFGPPDKEAPIDPQTGLYELEALTAASGKLMILRKMLEMLKKQGHRVLLFSQMTTMLDIFEDFLDGLGYAYERIDGSVNGRERQDAIDRFNAEESDDFVFLLSTRAGGLGINLATADTVIIYDSDFNPHNDIQAYSRAHRIGQKNKVMIYRFITRRSVEEKIMETCKKKMMLTHLVVRPEVGSKKFGREELENIIRFGTQVLFEKDDTLAPIHYTDSAIEELLDRRDKPLSLSQEAEQNISGVQDYFQSFNVAKCAERVLEAPGGGDNGIIDDNWVETVRKNMGGGRGMKKADNGLPAKRKRSKIVWLQDSDEEKAKKNNDAGIAEPAVPLAKFKNGKIKKKQPQLSKKVNNIKKIHLPKTLYVKLTRITV